MMPTRVLSSLFACLQTLIPAGLILASGVSRPLASQTPHAAHGWVSVAFDPGVTADVRVKILSTSTGYQLFFKNFGSTTAHFGFYLEGAQTQDAVSSNGRVHLKAGNGVGPLVIAPASGHGTTLQVHAVDTAVGNEDMPSSTSSAS